MGTPLRSCVQGTCEESQGCFHARWYMCFCSGMLSASTWNVPTGGTPVYLKVLLKLKVDLHIIFWFSKLIHRPVVITYSMTQASRPHRMPLPSSVFLQSFSGSFEWEGVTLCDIVRHCVVRLVTRLTCVWSIHNGFFDEKTKLLYRIQTKTMWVFVLVFVSD